MATLITTCFKTINGLNINLPTNNLNQGKAKADQINQIKGSKKTQLNNLNQYINHKSSTTHYQMAHPELRRICKLRCCFLQK